jgi:hypothetical protein
VTLVAFAAACSKPMSNDLATVTPPSPATSAASSTTPTSMAAPTGWSAEDEQKAATIIANGIKHSYPIDKRMAAGICAVAKFEKYYPTLADFMEESTLAPNGAPSSLDSLSRDLKVLGTCETAVGI